MTSEVLFKAPRNLQQFRLTKHSLSVWLYRIATNQSTDYFRKSRQEMFSLEESSNPIVASNGSVEAEVLKVEEELRSHKDFLLLRQGTSRLSFKHQEVIALKYFKGKHIKDIAEILGKREGTIESWLHRGLEELREFMEQNAAFQDRRVLVSGEAENEGRGANQKARKRQPSPG